MILSGQQETEYFLVLHKLSIHSGTANWSHNILSLSVADCQSRLFVSLLSSSSLHFQLINFLFWSLSPVSSISPFPYSHFRLLPPSLFPVVLFSPSRSSHFYVLTFSFLRPPESQCPHYSSYQSCPVEGHLPFSSSTSVLLNPHPHDSFTPQFQSSYTFSFFISTKQEAIVMYVSAPNQELSLRPSPPCSLLFSRCSGLRSECPAICVGEQR